MPYTVYSDFDTEHHKKTFTHYLEIVIDENGKIMYAVPSHQKKRISLACEKLTEQQIGALQMLKENGLYLGEFPRTEDMRNG